MEATPVYIDNKLYVQKPYSFTVKDACSECVAFSDLPLCDKLCPYCVHGFVFVLGDRK